MKCPTCNVDLAIADRSGVEIDYCPNCRGIWLDRGELDKIIDRSSQNDRSTARPEGPSPRHTPREDPRHYDDKRKKKGSFLEDLFDF